VTTTIPIVALDLESDPIASGFIASHARPGGNITGVFLDFPEFSKKWLEALNEIVPKLSRVAVFWDPAMAPVQLRAVEDAAQTLNLRLAVVEVRQWNDIEPAFQVATQQDAQALLMLASPLVDDGNAALLAPLAADLAARNVDLILAQSGAAVRAATEAIPSLWPNWH
jgi:putative ABC transport system substrate-binding protein